MKRLFYATTLLSAIFMGGGCAKDGDEAVLAISQETATLDEKAQSFDLTVTSNVYYRVNVQDEWINLTEVSASGNDRVYSVSVWENESTDTRVGTIKLPLKNLQSPRAVSRRNRNRSRNRETIISRPAFSHSGISPMTAA